MYDKIFDIGSRYLILVLYILSALITFLLESPASCNQICQVQSCIKKGSELSSSLDYYFNSFKKTSDPLRGFTRPNPLMDFQLAS